MNKAANAFVSRIVLLLSLVISINSQALHEGEKNGSAATWEMNRKAIQLVGEKKFQEAIEVLKNALAIERSGQTEIAVKHLNNALEIDPGSAVGHNQLGVAYEKLGKIDKAVASFNRAIKIKPDYAFGYFNLGATYLWADKIKPAREALEISLRLEPLNDQAQMLLGVVYARQSKYADAVRQMKNITQKDPSNEMANLLLCQIYVLSNDRGAALDMYQRYKGVNETLADAMFRTIFAGRVVFAKTELQH